MIHKIELEGDTLNLKKSKLFGWSIVYPLKIDGKYNWKNIILGGSWYNLIKVILVVGLILFIAFSYKHDMASCIKYGQETMKLNWSAIN
jgi:hypothetical protein